MRIRRLPLIITVGLGATAAVGAGITDAVVGHSAQQRIVRAATCRLQPSGPVTAQLTDTFAGLQVLTGNLGTVKITADGVHRGGTDMNVKAVLYNVTTHGSTDGGTATATIPYSALQQQLGSAAAGMTVGTDGTNLTLTGTFGGLGLPVTVNTSVTTSANSLTVTPTTVSLLGQAVPVGALSGLGANLQPHTVNLPGLPAGAHLTGARPDSSGLSLQIAIPHTTGLSINGPGTNGLAKTTGASQGSACSSAKV